MTLASRGGEGPRGRSGQLHRAQQSRERDPWEGTHPRPRSVCIGPKALGKLSELPFCHLKKESFTAILKGSLRIQKKRFSSSGQNRECLQHISSCQTAP